MVSVLPQNTKSTLSQLQLGLNILIVKVTRRITGIIEKFAPAHIDGNPLDVPPNVEEWGIVDCIIGFTSGVVFETEHLFGVCSQKIRVFIPEIDVGIVGITFVVFDRERDVPNAGSGLQKRSEN